MITPIGPWVELIAVLTASAIIRRCTRYNVSQATMITAVTAACGIAGIVGTASGFVIPTIYFLDTQVFAQWFASPWHALLYVGIPVFVAGLWGMMLALSMRRAFLEDQNMSFPIGHMVRNVVRTSHQDRSSHMLAGGFLGTIGYGVLQHIAGWIPSWTRVTQRAYRWGALHIPQLVLKLDIAPMMLAIGFVAGHVLAIPLSVGVVTKLVILNPLNYLWFPSVSERNAMLAFSSGMLIYSTMTSFTRLPQICASAWHWIKSGYYSLRHHSMPPVSSRSIRIGGITAVACALTLWWYTFSFSAQIYTLVLTMLCIYQILIIAGRVGLAPFGRFATFLMLPGILLFSFGATHITLISAFVAISCGVAADTMFGQKAAQADGVDTQTVTRYQILGLCVAASVIGPLLWVLFTKLELGSPELYAQRAQARALLVSLYQFDYGMLSCGILWGIILHLCGINATLVFSGLLFSIELSLLLILGAMLASCVNDKKQWEPLFSGIFAANSLWLVLQALYKALVH